ncbi:metallophosphoesterase [Candidatus Woesearchaeota archaeon]|nr:metallophosphoesterase [Candidatus Woesearchaeota archaeon]
MKILAFGDLHGDSKLAEKLADRAEQENVDLVVMCGDITYAETSIENLIGPFIKKNKKVILIPGNHETLATAEFLARQYGATNLHGYSIKHENVGLFGCGGATNVGPAPILTENEMFYLLKAGHERIKDMKKRIMITHMHAADSKAEFSGFKGSKGIKKAINELKPDLLLCGHIHEASGLEEQIGNTKVINVSKEGRIIEL